MKRSDQPQSTSTSTANRTPSRLAWSLALLAATLSLVGVVVTVYYALTTGDMSHLLSHAALNPFIAIIYGIVGALVASRHPRNTIGWIFVSVAVLSALNIAVGAYGRYTVVSQSTGVTDVALANWLGSWFWLPTFFLPTIFVFYLFPDGRLPSRRWAVLFGAAAAGVAMVTAGVALHPGPLELWQTGPNPYGLPESAELLDGFNLVGAGLLTVGSLGAIAALILRFRSARGVEQEQMKWLVYALGLFLLGVVGSVVAGLVWPENEWVLELSIAGSNLTILLVAVAASIAILRHQLYDINLVIYRTLLYGALTASVITIYVFVVSGLGTLFQAQGHPFIALLTTGLVAVLFHPLQEWLQRGVNRLFYGERDEPLAALSRLGKRLEAAIAPDVVLPTLVEVIAQTLKLPYVAITLGTGEELTAAAAVGTEVESTLSLPLIYQGEKVGQLIAGSRGVDEPFSQTDRRLLEHIAHQAGPAVHAVQLTAALQHSRLQMVRAREEERRRLQRDLHDGLGATLAALNLEAGVLRRAIRSDPAEAEALVDELRVEIRAMIDDIRRLVYALRPPTLDQLGLVAAVRAHASQCSRPSENGDARLQVEIEAPEELPPLPAAVEVAAYRIAQEALTNVVRHAQARHCLVRLELNGALNVEIRDDGVGLPAGGRQNGGLGLLSMRERAVELGGTCVIGLVPGGGTRILASLPLPKV